jgi:hypothetical protein
METQEEILLSLDLQQHTLKLQADPAVVVLVMVQEGVEVPVLLTQIHFISEGLEPPETERLTKAAAVVEEQEIPRMEVLLLVHLGVQEVQETQALETVLMPQQEQLEQLSYMVEVEQVEDLYLLETEETEETDTLD